VPHPCRPWQLPNHAAFRGDILTDLVFVHILLPLKLLQAIYYGKIEYQENLNIWNFSLYFMGFPWLRRKIP
jgi:hypothetical protein